MEENNEIEEKLGIENMPTETKEQANDEVETREDRSHAVKVLDILGGIFVALIFVVFFLLIIGLPNKIVEWQLEKHYSVKLDHVDLEFKPINEDSSSLNSYNYEHLDDGTYFYYTAYENLDESDIFAGGFTTWYLKPLNSTHEFELYADDIVNEVNDAMQDITSNENFTLLIEYDYNRYPLIDSYSEFKELDDFYNLYEITIITTEENDDSFANSINTALVRHHLGGHLVCYEVDQSELNDIKEFGMATCESESSDELMEYLKNKDIDNEGKEWHHANFSGIETWIDVSDESLKYQQIKEENPDSLGTLQFVLDKDTADEQEILNGFEGLEGLIDSDYYNVLIFSKDYAEEIDSIAENYSGHTLTILNNGNVVGETLVHPQFCSGTLTIPKIEIPYETFGNVMTGAGDEPVQKVFTEDYEIQNIQTNDDLTYFQFSQEDNEIKEIALDYLGDEYPIATITTDMDCDGITEGFAIQGTSQFPGGFYWINARSMSWKCSGLYFIDENRNIEKIGDWDGDSEDISVIAYYHIFDDTEIVIIDETTLYTTKNDKLEKVPVEYSYGYKLFDSQGYLLVDFDDSVIYPYYLDNGKFVSCSAKEITLDDVNEIAPLDTSIFDYEDDGETYYPAKNLQYILRDNGVLFVNYNLSYDDEECSVLKLNDKNEWEEIQLYWNHCQLIPTEEIDPFDMTRPMNITDDMDPLYEDFLEGNTSSIYTYEEDGANKQLEIKNSVDEELFPIGEEEGVNYNYALIDLNNDGADELIYDVSSGNDEIDEIMCILKNIDGKLITTFYGETHTPRMGFNLYSDGTLLCWGNWGGPDDYELYYNFDENGYPVEVNNCDVDEDNMVAWTSLFL